MTSPDHLEAGAALVITISSYRITVSVMANEQPVSHFTLTSFLTSLEPFLEL